MLSQVSIIYRSNDLICDWKLFCRSLIKCCEWSDITPYWWCSLVLICSPLDSNINYTMVSGVNVSTATFFLLPLTILLPLLLPVAVDMKITSTPTGSRYENQLYCHSKLARYTCNRYKNSSMIEMKTIQ